jgi:hypothetical protein
MRTFHVLKHAVAGFTPEVVYNGAGVVSATWRCAAWSRVVEAVG